MWVQCCKKHEQTYINKVDSWEGQNYTGCIRDLDLNLLKDVRGLFFGSLMTTFEHSSIVEAGGAILKLGWTLKSQHRVK